MRLDLFLTERGLAKSRTEAARLIEEGAVKVLGVVRQKPSFPVAEDTASENVTVSREAHPYVSRGGEKLAAALTAFSLSPLGCHALDVGASSGGFTDCLLKNGAAGVFAVDAGHGQLHPTLREDLRVRSAEGMNARNLIPADLLEVDAAWHKEHPHAPDTPFSGLVDGIVMDVSFISQTLLHPALASVLKDGGWMVALIKPQFELTKSALNRQGIVKQERDRKAAVERVLTSAAACGFHALSVIPSPIEGGDGNREFLAYFVKRK